MLKREIHSLLICYNCFSLAGFGAVLHFTAFLLIDAVTGGNTEPKRAAGTVGRLFVFIHGINMMSDGLDNQTPGIN